MLNVVVTKSMRHFNKLLWFLLKRNCSFPHFIMWLKMVDICLEPIMEMSTVLSFVLAIINAPT